jgi:4-amino-4-deoxy-L-arabinose transferase-like glycosyltransferase
MSRELPGVAFNPRALRFIFHPPLYLYFIGVVQALFGSLEAVKYAQAVVGALLAPAVGLVGRRDYGARTGLVAAGIAACYPELVWFVSHYWAETVFTVLLWWGLERTTAADERGSWPMAAAAGALLGLATLTRETVLYFLPAAALWLAWRRAGGARRAAALLLAALLLVVPWTVRNYLAFDAFVPVSTSGALNLWQGNARMSREQVYEEYWAVHGRIAKYEHARKRGIEAVIERQPWWIFEKLRAEMPEYWAAHGQPVVHIERGAYGHVDRPIAFAAIALVLLPYLALLVLFVAGIAFLPRERPSVLLLGFLAFYVLLHVASHGYPRYRLPSMPVVFLVAAHGWTAWRSRPRPAIDREHALAAAAVALALALSVGPSLVTWATQPWPPPWFAEETGTGTEGPSESPGPGPTRAPEHP